MPGRLWGCVPGLGTEQLPASTSNTNKTLPQLARPCQALEFHEIKASGWRYAPTEIDAVYCANKPEVHCS